MQNNERTRDKMIVNLIPFFLAASIGVNEHEWRYGPEAIYDVKLDAKSYKLGQSPDNAMLFNISMKLHCRPKSRLLLSCETRNSDWGLTDSDFCNNPFELKYDSNGLSELIVPSSIRPMYLDMTRAIVAQLNIGGSFSVLQKNEFSQMENFTTGTCKTNYVVSSKDTKDTKEERKTTKNRYETIIVPDTRIPKGTTKEIVRTRNLDNCVYRVDYFFGSQEGYESDEPRKIETKTKSSISHMIIKEGSFISRTENVVQIRITNTTTRYDKGTVFALVERITLSLEGITPASGPLPIIPDSATASIFPIGWSHNNSSEEDYSSEEKNDFN